LASGQRLADIAAQLPISSSAKLGRTMHAACSLFQAGNMLPLRAFRKIILFSTLTFEYFSKQWPSPPIFIKKFHALDE